MTRSPLPALLQRPVSRAPPTGRRATIFGNWKSPLSLTARSGKTIPARISPSNTGSLAGLVREMTLDIGVSSSSPSVRKVVLRGMSELLGTSSIVSQENDKVLGSNDKDVGSHPTRKTKIRKTKMSPAIEARVLLRDAFPLARYGKLENVFYQAVRFIAPRVTKDFTPRRARSIWEGTARRIDSDEMDALRAALIEESKIEQQQLRSRLAALDEKIASFEATSHRETLARSGKEMGR